MNKTDLIKEIAENTELTQKDIGTVVDAVISTITDTLSRGEDVQLIGFGTFTTSERKARKGRNPQTGAEIDIAATTVPRFKAGKALKEAVKDN